MLIDDSNEFAGCNERFGELCALSATGALTLGESRDLGIHLATCAKCTALRAEYQALVSHDMTGIGAILFDSEKMAAEIPEWSQASAKKAVLAKVAHKQRFRDRTTARSAPQRRHPALRIAGIAAAILIVVTLSYLLGRQHSPRNLHQIAEPTALAVRPSNPPSAGPSNLVASLGTERNSIQAPIKDVRRPLQQPPLLTDADQRKLAVLQAQEAALEKSLDQLSREKAVEQDRVAALSSEKAALQQQLDQTRGQVQNLTLDLERVKQEYERDSLRNANTETEVNSLRERLGRAENDHEQTEQFLASDRDIRELMGARQLYIADVFDVNQEGKSKAYGRIFYTKGKSLIFYAFDLDQQPAVRYAKSFQAWGRSDATRSSPVSLGIFYLDNSANRRWILKSDDPDVLEQINSVFVTVEPPGGSKKPSSRPFLLAYLRSLPPNHP
jgi:hypothetical protein